MEEEAELLGMHAGDGTLYLAGKTLVWELRGSVYEKEYYAYVANMLKRLFNIEVIPKYRGPNSYGIQTTKKEITSFFIQNGFKPGRKVYTVSVPDHVKVANDKAKRSFIRGLFDTDGCVRFEKNKTPFYYYPRIEFAFASKPLRDDLFQLFNELGFRSRICQSVRKDGISFRVALCGFANLDKWIKEIKPANLKHLNRIKNGLANKDKVKLKRVSKNI